MDIERGWFYLADLDPRRGTEAGKTRPVLVLQTDLLNQHRHPSTVVIPTTTNLAEAYPLRVRIAAGRSGFAVDSDLMIDQIRAIDNRRLYRRDGKRLIKKIARIDGELLDQVEECLKALLDLP
jgi:mRNA interferase MazF